MAKQKVHFSVREVGKKENILYQMGSTHQFNNVVNLKILLKGVPLKERPQFVESLRNYLAYYNGYVSKKSRSSVTVALPAFWRAFKIHDFKTKQKMIVVYDLTMTPRITINYKNEDTVIVHRSMTYHIYKDKKAGFYISNIYKGGNLIHRIKGKGVEKYVFGTDTKDDQKQYDALELITRDHLNQNFPNWEDVMTYWD